MITASHNPSEYNGIKPVASDGVEISRQDEEVIEEFFLKRIGNLILLYMVLQKMILLQFKRILME